MSQTPAQWQWTPAEEKQLRQLREKGVSLEEIAKMFPRSYSAVARKCRAMGLTNQTLRRVAPPPKQAPDVRFGQLRWMEVCPGGILLLRAR